eukprot:TRINITY_DN3461_c0_g1_i1.p1 TRINITY_DN3461_c0_g1~~TRINITY_DN3461_c0_g1_i1.p1  ORF type:complete len:295 (-),score=63.21 TRINITY_DN3461_c0_g1_i1:204-1088(-)
MSSSSSSSSDDASGAQGGAFDGNFDGRIIEGESVTWKDGSKSTLQYKSPTTCSIVVFGETYEGKIDANGIIHWSDGGVWVRNESLDESKVREALSKLPKDSHFHGKPEELRLELLRLQRDAKERILDRANILQCQCGAWNGRTRDGRCTECGKDQKREEDVYIGKPHMTPSWSGGGWGGPKEGHDKDERFMERGDARLLPEDLYESWAVHGRFISTAEQKMMDARKVAEEMDSDSDSDSSSEDDKKKKKKLKKKGKQQKDKKGKKSKKGKKDKKTKKGKKEKGKKVKKDGKKKK